VRTLPVAEVAEVTSSVGNWVELLRPVEQIGWLAGERAVLRSAAEASAATDRGD
jgi:hypothetical protein